MEHRHILQLLNIIPLLYVVYAVTWYVCKILYFDVLWVWGPINMCGTKIWPFWQLKTRSSAKYFNLNWTSALPRPKHCKIPPPIYISATFPLHHWINFVCTPYYRSEFVINLILNNKCMCILIQKKITVFCHGIKVIVRDIINVEKRSFPLYGSNVCEKVQYIIGFQDTAVI